MEQVPKQCPPDECLGAFGSVFVFFEYRMLPEKRFFAASPTIVSGDASFAENEPNKTDRQGLPQQVKNNRAEPVGERPARILIRNRCKLPVWDFRKRRPDRTWDQVTFPLLIKTTINILIERGKSKGHAHPATLLADIGTIRANLVFVFSIFPPLTVLAPRAMDSSRARQPPVFKVASLPARATSPA
jgi:hypothetical protein